MVDEKNISQETPPASPAGGCSLGCASLFALAAFIWPVLHVLARTYEPEVLILSFVIGGPAFLVGNILALVSLSSKAPASRRLAKWALRLMWGLVTLFFLIALAGMAMERISGER